MRIQTVLLLGAMLSVVTLASGQSASSPATPIHHLVVIFQENNSFDHYFGTYPNAANPPGEPVFHAAPNTPVVNGLTALLLQHNPNSIAPFRIDRGTEVLCDNDNHYTDEQKAYDHGLLDQFPQDTNGSGCPGGNSMGYYDGNTVTALWNYASQNTIRTTIHSSTTPRRPIRTTCRRALSPW